MRVGEVKGMGGNEKELWGRGVVRQVVGEVVGEGITENWGLCNHTGGTKNVEGMVGEMLEVGRGKVGRGGETVLME